MNVFEIGEGLYVLCEGEELCAWVIVRYGRSLLVRWRRRIGGLEYSMGSNAIKAGSTRLRWLMARSLVARSLGESKVWSTNKVCDGQIRRGAYRYVNAWGFR